MTIKHLASTLTGVAVLAPVTAMAHPGHGGLEPTSAVHHLFELPHALWLIGGGILVVGLVARRRRHSARTSISTPRDDDRTEIDM